MTRRVTLLTDFGTRDGYVAAMKGVLASLAPDALLDDAGHDLDQGDLHGAMWALSRYWDRYPAGSVHLVVVDPGVGTRRLPLALEADGRFVVAPDNGVISRVVARAGTWRTVAIDDAPGRLPEGQGSTTFHGRDVFAPAAGLLAAGRPLDELGPVLETPVLLREPHPRRERGEAAGEVVAVDRFGNLITNLPGEWVGEHTFVEVKGHALPFVVAYAFGERGAPLALVNSDRLVEVAVRDGSAADLLGAGPGTPVRLTG